MFIYIKYDTDGFITAYQTGLPLTSTKLSPAKRM